MRMPAPVRSGSRTSSCGARGGGNAPASGGSVSRAGASLATVTGRQSGAVDDAPFTMRRMSRSAAPSLSLRPAIPVSASTAETASSSDSWRAHSPSSARWGHCASSADGSPEPMVVCCGWSTWRFSFRRPKPTMAAPMMYRAMAISSGTVSRSPAASLAMSPSETANAGPAVHSQPAAASAAASPA